MKAFDVPTAEKLMQKVVMRRASITSVNIS
jgi:hypothetical protein